MNAIPKWGPWAFQPAWPQQRVVIISWIIIESAGLRAAAVLAKRKEELSNHESFLFYTIFSWQVSSSSLNKRQECLPHLTLVCVCMCRGGGGDHACSLDADLLRSRNRRIVTHKGDRLGWCSQEGGVSQQVSHSRNAAALQSWWTYLYMCGSLTSIPNFSSVKVKIKCWIQPPVDIWSSGLSTFQFLLGDCVRLFLQTNLNAALIWLHHLPIIAWMAGWYVTVNVTNCSHNCCPGPYQAVLRRSLTPLHFIIPRLVSVLGSDSGFCYGFTDKITGK